MYNFNFRVELVLKNAYIHIITLSRKDSVYYLQKFSHAQFQSIPTLKSQGQACLICFVLLQIIISFPRDQFKCSHLVWILLYTASVMGTKELIFIILLPISFVCFCSLLSTISVYGHLK